ncbi:MAG: alkaline phosphatase family protein [Chloroflexi bacterium]|nr:alkaline phosphatase family protein [Chloroflexota bacterium]
MSSLNEIAENALLQRQRLPEAFGAEAVRPSYDGLGLVNVPALVLQLLAPATLLDKAVSVPPVNPALLDCPEVTAAFKRVLEQGPINHVVLLLIDAMGYDQINGVMATGDLPGLSQMVQNPANFFMPLTSVYPSTTTTALTSVATASTPQTHGIMGTVNRMPEMGSLVNLISFGPAVGSKSYTPQQLNPDTLLPVPNIYQPLEAEGVVCEQINFYAFENSSISRFTTANSTAKFISYRTPATAFATLRERLLSKPSDGSLKSFTYCYVDTLDAVGHRDGPLTPNYQAELAALDFSLNRELFQGLKGRSDLLLFVVADHGQRTVDPQKVAWLHEHPELTRLFVAPMGGERRVAYLYLKAGTLETARRYIDSHFGEHFLTLSKVEALEMGLFGLPGQAISSQADDRIGDLLMIPRREWITRQFVTATDKGPIGRDGVHGGLSRAEMLIPLLMARF